MIVDYHTHSGLCRHAHGNVEEYILRAIKLGFDEVGCSDHAPLPGNYDERHRMTLEEYYSLYAPAVSSLAERYRDRIRIKRGIECDYLEWATDWTAKFVRENDFDFVIGSVHFVGPLGEEKPLFGREYGEAELESLYEGYFQAILDSATSGLFDVVAHLDLIKKFGSFSSKRVDELVGEAMNRIKRSDLCIEINTSGLRRPEKDTYPGEKILALVRELHVPLTLGSDAHKPEDVGEGFERAVDLVETYGGGRIAVFDKRQRSEVKVSKIRRVA